MYYRLQFEIEMHLSVEAYSTLSQRAVERVTIE
jgi:hypothetical protein